jgi:hypothetical protein
MRPEKPITLRTLSVATPEQVDDLNRLIHDEWFDLEQIQHDPENRIVLVPYRRKHHGGPEKISRKRLAYTVKEKDVIQSQLRVQHVIDCHINDRAQIGGYTFNRVEFDPGTKKLLILCEPDLEIQLDVTALEVESLDLEIIGRAKTAYLFGLIEVDQAKWNMP